MNWARLQKVKVLGQGTFGKCYLVRNIDNQNLAVLKQIDGQGMTQEQTQEVLNEAEILQSLQHPCVIQFFDCTQEPDGHINILMEYADGGDLAQRIKQTNGIPFKEDQILGWFAQLCLAVKHVHQRHIIHRDIKCQNIFLTAENRIKLGDFGIAKPLQMTREKLRTMVGTPYYMSPEICENKEYTIKSDLWSLGVILYEMCMLKPPFDARSLPALALKITKGEYDPIIGPWSKSLKRIVSDLLQVDPARRPSACELLSYPIVRDKAALFVPRSFPLLDDAYKSSSIDIRTKRQDTNSVKTPQSRLVQGVKSTKLFLADKKKSKKGMGEFKKRQASEPNLLSPSGSMQPPIPTTRAGIPSISSVGKIKLPGSYDSEKTKRTHQPLHPTTKKDQFKKKQKPMDVRTELQSVKQLRDELVEISGQWNDPSLEQCHFQSQNNQDSTVLRSKALPNCQDSSLQLLLAVLCQSMSDGDLREQYSDVEASHGFPSTFQMAEKKYTSLLSLYYGLNSLVGESQHN